MNIGDWFLDNSLWIISGIFVLILGGVFYLSIMENHCCKTMGNRIVHQEAWTQFIYSGKTMIPIYHPAGDYDQRVCLEAKPDCN